MEARLVGVHTNRKRDSPLEQRCGQVCSGGGYVDWVEVVASAQVHADTMVQELLPDHEGRREHALKTFVHADTLSSDVVSPGGWATGVGRDGAFLRGLEARYLG
jgi:hypothetical protein